MKTCITCKYYSPRASPDSILFDGLVWPTCTIRMKATPVTEPVMGTTRIEYSGQVDCDDERSDGWRWTPRCGPNGLNWEAK